MTTVNVARIGTCLAVGCPCRSWAFTYRVAGWETCACGHTQGAHREIEIQPR